MKNNKYNNPFEELYQTLDPEWWFNKVQCDIEHMPNEKKTHLSDGYHSFDELYKHRYSLYIALCNSYVRNNDYRVYKTKIHNDGLDVWDEWKMFLVVVSTDKGDISYHLPNELWESVKVEELEKGLEWDGHTSDDVISRLLLI